MATVNVKWNVEDLDVLEQQLRDFDWWHSYSDAYNWMQQGRFAESALYDALRDAPQATLDFASAILAEVRQEPIKLVRREALYNGKSENPQRFYVVPTVK